MKINRIFANVSGRAAGLGMLNVYGREEGGRGRLSDVRLDGTGSVGVVEAAVRGLTALPAGAGLVTDRLSVRVANLRAFGRGFFEPGFHGCSPAFARTRYGCATCDRKTRVATEYRSCGRGNVSSSKSWLSSTGPDQSRESCEDGPASIGRCGRARFVVVDCARRLRGRRTRLMTGRAGLFPEGCN